MKIEEALARYVTQLEADGRSPHTIHQYQRHIGLLASWLRGSGNNGNVEEIDHETLATFLASSTARSRPDGATKKATSANALRTSLRTFFRYAHEAGYTRSNPARLVRRALCGTPPPRAMSDEEQGRLLLAFGAGVGPEAKRDHALFALMLGSGIRLGSALALETRDVDLERGELALRRTKGDVPTSLPLSRAVREHLRSYLEGRPDGPLFTGRGGRALCARHAQRRLGIWCRKAGVERRTSPHDLRHSFAIRLYKRTRDLLLVQQALRHRSIASTTVYARCDEGRLREALVS
ncbi:MAG: tyrosine-type recombinase/integrase [Planctomycetota bacterium]